MESSTVSSFLRKQGYALIAFLAILVFLIYPNIGMYDWNKEVQYCDFIKQSVLKYKMFPMFMWNSGILAEYPAVKQSAFFAGNPETFLFSPFLPLLLILSPVVFLKLILLIHFLIGWAGIQVLTKTCAWNTRQTRIFSAAYLLSPIIIQHISIGYMPWATLYFFPWLLHYLLNKDPFKKWMGTSVVLALILLEGGLHVFVWLVFFIAFYSLLQAIFQKNGKSLLLAAASGLTACLLALPRIVSSFQAFGAFEQKFFSGYSPGAFFKWGLTPPFFTPSSMDDIEFFIEEYIKGVPYWDGSLFWGFVLICALTLPFVIAYLHLKNRKIKFTEHELDVVAVAGASLLILLLSFDALYADGISALSDLIHIPALKGMEKYPFRFAIPGYFGFSFVTAWYWEHIQHAFTRALNIISAAAVAGWNGFIKIAAVLRSQKKRLMWVAAGFVSLCILFTVLKPTLLGWMYSQVSLAYSGEGADYLSRLMEHSAAIPLESYFSKTAALTSKLLRVLIVFTIGVVSAWLIAVLYDLDKIKEYNQRIKNFSFPFWLMEVLLVFPLLLAFGMWWRVSLATPITTIPYFEMQPPMAVFSENSINLELPGMHVTPQTLELEIDDGMVGSTLIFTKIPYNDTRFLTIKKGEGMLVDHTGKTALEINRVGLMRLQVSSNSLVFAAIIGAIAWMSAGGLIIGSVRKI